MISEIRFGAMSPPLTEQLQGTEYDAKEIGHCQRLADAVSDLWIASMATDTEVKQIRKRIGKRIFAALKAREGGEGEHY